MRLFSDEDVDSALQLFEELIERVQKREKKDKGELGKDKLGEIRKIFLERFQIGLESVKSGANVPPSAIFPHILNGILQDPKKFGMACGFLAGVLRYSPKHILEYHKEFAQIIKYLLKNQDYKKYTIKRVVKWKKIMLEMKEQNKLSEEEFKRFEEFLYEIGLG